MELSKEHYKKHLKSIYLPTVELVIDEIVDNMSDKLFNIDVPSNTIKNIVDVTSSNIVEGVVNSKSVRKAHKEFIMEYKYNRAYSELEEDRERSARIEKNG
jgi:hypothetical protein